MKASLEKFRKEWIKKFGKANNEKDARFLIVGIKDFYEDYRTSEKNLEEYLNCICRNNIKLAWE